MAWAKDSPHVRGKTITIFSSPDGDIPANQRVSDAGGAKDDGLKTRQMMGQGFGARGIGYDDNNILPRAV